MMKIANLLHFTENHRFQIYRDFSLSSLDYKMLSMIYQPMVGPDAIALFHVLFQQLPSDKCGYSALEQQRKLFLVLAIEPNEQGRKKLSDHASKLEAIGLMQTFRKYLTESDDYIYEYQLFQPLSPAEFFENQHLVLLLRDKIGKRAVVFVREELEAAEAEELTEQHVNVENLSVPFYDLFELNTQVIDYELEQALAEIAPARAMDMDATADEPLIHYSDIILRFPRDSRNRTYVEQLNNEAEQLATINYVAKKYNLSLMETCRLLDEDGIFTNDGALDVEVMQQKAVQNFRQNVKRDQQAERNIHKLEKMSEAVSDDSEHDSQPQEEKVVEMAYYLDIPPMFVNQANIHQYNMLLRNEPYTHVLKRFFPGDVPDHVSKIFEKIDLNYKLKEEVINVLIHYLKVENLSWNSAFIDSIVADMLGKQVNSYEDAVKYIRNHNEAKAKAAERRKNKGRSAIHKPHIPIATASEQEEISDEEYEAMLEIARKLEGNE